MNENKHSLVESAREAWRGGGGAMRREGAVSRYRKRKKSRGGRGEKKETNQTAGRKLKVWALVGVCPCMLE